MDRYFSLNDLDRKLERYVDFDNGFFVEAGANNGLKQSNTAYFEFSRGWSGVLVEPIPNRFSQCRLNRPGAQVFWNALSPPDWPEPYVELVYCDLMTVTKSPDTRVKLEDHIAAGVQFLHGELPYNFYAPARTLTSILQQAALPKIDFLSLDIEGFEIEVLKGLNLQQFAIEFICIEAFDVAATTNALKDFYSFEERLSVNDYLFRRK